MNLPTLHALWRLIVAMMFSAPTWLLRPAAVGLAPTSLDREWPLPPDEEQRYARLMIATYGKLD